MAAITALAVQIAAKVTPKDFNKPRLSRINTPKFSIALPALFPKSITFSANCSISVLLVMLCSAPKRLVPITVVASCAALANTAI